MLIGCHSPNAPGDAAAITFSSTTANSCQTATHGGAWLTEAFTTAETGNFTATFDATPSVAPIDVTMGLSLGAQSAFSGLSAMVRFNPSGDIDARNGAAYTTSTMPYSKGVDYHFRLVVNPVAHTYSAYVTAGTAAEALIASNLAFRDVVSSLNSADVYVDASDGLAGSVSFCNLTVTSNVPTPPTVAMSSPQSGSTLALSITLAATATAAAGVMGIQFMVDGANSGAEVTIAPYQTTLDTTKLANGSHTFSAKVTDATGATATSTAVTATVQNAAVGTLAAHPRLFLDSATLATLKARALASATVWTTLRTACNSYLGGTVNYPDGATYPNLPNLGSGYQGDGYVDPLLNVALCYQIGKQIGDANTAQWGAKGSDILDKMSNSVHAPAYSTDSGYGIRNYGEGLAIGYDWLYPVLTPALLAQVYTQINGWLTYWDASGFGNNQPCGNYFAGYYQAKALGSLATTGENPSAPAQWSDFLNRLHRGGANSVGSHTGVQSYFAAHMSGGGWPEGWEYGPGALVHMTLPALGVLTATGIDLINDTTRPYSYPIDNGEHLMQLAWPSLTNMDDRDMNHAGNDPASFPSAPNVNAYTVVAGMLTRYKSALAPQYHSFARAIRKQNGNGSAWVDALFWDDSATEQAYSAAPLSYESTGLNTVSMRSDWTTSAVWGSLRASAYVDNVDSGEQYFDAGGLAIVKGGTPLLVNAAAFLVTSYPGTTIGYEDSVYNEIYGSGALRRLFNTFYDGTAGQAAVAVDGNPAPTTRVSRFEDHGAYTLTRADGLADVYKAGVSSWSRTVVYFRPDYFIVYDSTAVSDLLGDQHMNWHLLFTPSQVSTPSLGAERFDVNNPTAGFMGSVTTLLPAASVNTLVNVFSSNKVYRLEVRPAVPALTQDWLTVFDASASAAAVSVASAVTSTNGNGALLPGATNYVAMFADAPASGMTFTIPAAASKVVIANLTANTGYTVKATAASGAMVVTVTPSGSTTSSASGTVYVNVSALGTVSAGT